MRILKQLLLLVVVVGMVNALRFRSAPAQGNGQPVARSGDTNCDGKIDITDPIIVLNWLFSDGPAPCAIAQEDTCCADLRSEVAALRATVDALAARIPGPNDLVTLRGTVAFTRNEPKVLIDVPEGKRFVVTSFWWAAEGAIGAKLASMTDGQPSLIPIAPGDEYTSGFAFPAGSDVGVVLDAFRGPLNAEYYINGYLVAG